MEAQSIRASAWLGAAQETVSQIFGGSAEAAGRLYCLAFVLNDDLLCSEWQQGFGWVPHRDCTAGDASDSKGARHWGPAVREPAYLSGWFVEVFIQQANAVFCNFCTE